MKSFDEYLKETIDANPKAVLADCLVWTCSDFKRDYLASKQSDHLALWKALKAWDRVLEIKPKTLWTISDIDKDFIHMKASSGAVWHMHLGSLEHNRELFQIIPSGPFDASKCYLGMWVWLEERLMARWAKISTFNPGCNDPRTYCVGLECSAVCYKKDGTGSDGKQHLFFSPPSPAKEDPMERAVKEIEKAVNDVLCGEDNASDYDKKLRSILTEFREAASHE